MVEIVIGPPRLERKNMMVPAQWRGIREFWDHVLKHPHKVTDIYTHGFTGFIFTGFEQTKPRL